jgi:EAL domain-containing protein (putative c-di-GMP-specific phosphodiesterase class I)
VVYPGDFEVVFQPIVDLLGRTAVAYEALSRFPSGSSPLAHFADPGRQGGDVDLEIIAVEKAVDAARFLPVGVPITVNVSPLSLETPRLKQILEAADRPVGIEITEHHRVTNYPRLRALIENLSPWKVLVDGGGAGYSTLDHIRLLEPNVIKLSASLTARLDSVASDKSLIESFVSMANDSDASVLASALETEIRATRALEFGISLGQGFLFGAPQSASRLKAQQDDPRALPAVENH